MAATVLERTTAALAGLASGLLRALLAGLGALDVTGKVAASAVLSIAAALALLAARTLLLARLGRNVAHKLAPRTVAAVAALRAL